MKKWCRRAVCMVLLIGVLSFGAGATNWGLWYGNGVNQPPRGEDNAQTLAQYGAYYMGNAGEKVIYLTFDCGYENGYTGKILDVLKKHHVPAAFFVVGHYLDAAPALVKRMVNEGHLVCNHSKNHPNMTRVSRDRFEKELTQIAVQYKALTGRELSPFFRPPEGAYSHEMLGWAQSMGYHTTMWSVAHADWDPKQQPSYAKAKTLLNQRIHNGAIVLLHTVSATNTGILDDLITEWKAKGYRFAALSALPGMANPTVTAIPNDARFIVGQAEVKPTAFLIEGENYIKLRDLAQALSGTEKAFSVDYDIETQMILLERGGEYVPLGTELAGLCDAAARQMKASTQKIALDGAPLEIAAYGIDGVNYVKLRDLARMLDCGVTYDSATKTVGLEPAYSYE